jgi:hypothetical protein
VFERCQFRISAETLAILIEGFRNLPQSLQASVGIVPLLLHDRFLSDSL